MKKSILSTMLIGLLLAGCGDGVDKAEEKAGNSDFKEKVAAKFGLTVFELENGVGPVKEKMKLGPLDGALAAKGQKLFDEKCASCHKLDERFTGPAQRDVVERRSPEYIMNMILNPDEMINRHPEAKKMLAIYMTKMTFQNVTQEDARAILEYFRKVDKEK